MSYDFPNAPTIGQQITMASGARYQFDGAKWVAAAPAGPVTSWNGRTGAVTLGTTDITAALGYTPYSQGNPSGYQTAAQVSSSLASYVPLAGATLTGTLRLAADPVGLTDAATRRYVDNAVAGVSVAGVPLILTSVGAVTLTGIIAETNMLALRIPANTIGRNGAIEIKVLFTYTNSAGAKTLTLRFGTASGAVTGGLNSAIGITTTATSQAMWIIRNNNATNAQQMYSASAVTPFNSVGTAPAAGTIDTTADTYLNFNGTIASAGDTLTLAHVYAVVFPHG